MLQSFLAACHGLLTTDDDSPREKEDVAVLAVEDGLLTEDAGLVDDSHDLLAGQDNLFADDDGLVHGGDGFFASDGGLFAEKTNGAAENAGFFGSLCTIGLVEGLDGI